MSKKKGLQKVKEYADNHILMIALGAHNDNVKRLQKKLGVDIKTKGNQITIEGEQDSVEHAFDALDRLYGVAKKNGDVNNSDIDNILNLENGIAVQMHTRLKKQMDDLEQLANLTQKYHVLTNEMNLDFLSAKEEPEKVHPEPAAQVEPKEAAPEPEIQPANEPDTHVTEPEPDKQPAEEEKESGAAKPNRSLQDVLEKQSLSDFKKAFSLNDRFRFRQYNYHSNP